MVGASEGLASVRAVPIRMELEMPAAGDSLSFAELREFVGAVEAAHNGHDEDLPVEAVAPIQDDAMIVALRVELDVTTGTSRTSAVRLDRQTLAQLIEVLQGIADTEGDARGLLGKLSELRRELVDIGVGVERS